jgi:AraC-like DNA-binding protein
MQYQPSLAPQIELAPIGLVDDFPISCGKTPFTQTDEPILSLHIHDCLEVGYCHSGAGLFVVENKIFSYGPGDVSVINEREAHLAQSTRGTVSTWSFMSMLPQRLVSATGPEAADLRAADLCGSGFKNIVAAHENPELSETARQLALELQSERPGYRSVVRGLVWALMARFHRLPGRSTDASTESRLGRIAPALEHMAGSYAQQITMDHLAALCHMSETNFRRLFKTATGYAPYTYLTRLRAHMAGTLLRNGDMTVLAIAMETGFPTLSSFNRSFKSVMGATPREWRRGTTAWAK